MRFAGARMPRGGSSNAVGVSLESEPERSRIKASDSGSATCIVGEPTTSVTVEVDVEASLSGTTSVATPDVTPSALLDLPGAERLRPTRPLNWPTADEIPPGLESPPLKDEPFVGALKAVADGAGGGPAPPSLPLKKGKSCEGQLDGHGWKRDQNAYTASGGMYAWRAGSSVPLRSVSS